MSETESELAVRWGCDVRTVRRWKKEGAPFGDDTKMRVWLSSRRSVPAGTDALLRDMRQQHAKQEPQNSPSEVLKGLPAALERLEDSEAVAFKAYRRAVDSGDAVAIKTERRNWLELVENLRKSDESVDDNKRGAGEVLPREQFERALWGVSHCLNIAYRTIAYLLCDQAKREVLTKDPIALYELLHQAQDIAIAANHFDLPDWSVKSLRTVSPFKDKTARTEKAVQLINALIESRSNVIEGKIVPE